MIKVTLDFETCNPYCDLTVVGSTVYAQHWATEILCLNFDGQRWTPDEGTNEGAITARLMAYARKPDVIFVAHGAGFEKDIWREIMVPVFGFPDVPNDRWHDTMAVCALKAVGFALEDVLPPLCGVEKDTVGTAVVLSLGRFGPKGHRKWSPTTGHPKDKKGRDLPTCERTPEIMQRSYDYCADDVAKEIMVDKRVGGLGRNERAVWLMDQTINERGVMLDRGFLEGAQKIVDAARGPLEKEFRLLTGGIGPGQTAKIGEWLRGQGVEIENLRKETIAELLGDRDEESDDEDVGSGFPDQARLDALPGNVRRALVIRSLVGSASIRKIPRMEGSIARDGRTHRLLQYHGTGPGRWSGRLWNILNFPRGTAVRGDTRKPCDPDTLARAVLTGDCAAVHELGLVVEDPPFSKQWRSSDPIEVVSSGLRHAVVAAPGRLLVVGDFVQIQARIVLALAGQTDFLAKLAAGADPYCMTAEKIYKLPEGSLTKENAGPMRQPGKNTFLGCGFEMGGQTYCQKYVAGCQCKPGTRCEYPDSEPRQFANTGISAYRKEIAPKVAAPLREGGLWRSLEDAAFRAVVDKVPVESHGVEYRLEDGWLTARLPSNDGKKVWYWNPEECEVERFGKRKRSWRFQTVNKGRLQWKYAYGGLVTENVVMGLERQKLVRTMMRCERENLPVIFNSYDEIVTEPEAADASWPALQQIMEDREDWEKAMGLPIAAEGWVGPRYKKG